MSTFVKLIQRKLGTVHSPDNEDDGHELTTSRTRAEQADCSSESFSSPRFQRNTPIPDGKRKPSGQQYASPQFIAGDREIPFCIPPSLSPKRRISLNIRKHSTNMKSSREQQRVSCISSFSYERLNMKEHKENQKTCTEKQKRLTASSPILNWFSDHFISSCNAHFHWLKCCTSTASPCPEVCT